ncbi:ABC transporter substrate-binding protein [Streptosporangium sp. NPDC002721]|uniref:ABC transporter substrate-binding protein n=1 Tax=Streptosporangium sp. NPDC002721 TaxID=3366188 RepID=UPI0036C7F0ED
MACTPEACTSAQTAAASGSSSHQTRTRRCTNAAKTASNASASAAPGGAEGGYPVTISSCGRDHTFDKAPSRVVVGNENTLRTLDALSVSAAVHGYVLSPDSAGQAPTGLPENLVQVSATTIPAREPVIAAKPDLFLSFNEAQLTTQGALSYDDLAGAGANAYVMGAYCAQNPDNSSIDTVYTDITNLGKIFGVSGRAQELNETLKNQVAAAKESLNGSTATVANLKVAGEKVYAVGGYPASAVTDALGLKNQFADLPTPFAELSAEQALAMAPDVVFVNHAGDEQAAIDQLKQALPDLKAIRDGHVHGLDENGPQGGGVGVIAALESVSADVKTSAK